MNFLNNYIVANVLMLVIFLFTLTGIHWTIKKFFAKHIQRNRWVWFFSSIILTTILLGLLRNKSWDGYVSYLIDSFQHADILVILGLVVAVVGCIIGLAVFEKISYSEAKNLSQFLHIFNEILDDAVKDDKLRILLPSYYIGGTGSVRERRSKKEVELSDEHSLYCKNLVKAHNRGVHLYFAVLDYTGINFNELNSPGPNNDPYDIIRKIDTSPMKKFHWEVADDLLESNDDKIKYFKQLYEYSNQIQTTILTTKVTKLSAKYDTDNKICGVINLNKTVAIFGSYSYKGGIDLGGSKIITKNAVDCIKDLFGDIIKKNNMDINFVFKTWIS